MRTHRVFLRPLRAGHVTLQGREAHHLAQVLRVRPGQAVRAFDGLGREALGTVARVDDNHVTLELSEPGPGEVEAPCRLTLAVALLKGDKMADVVRMGTELGVARFIPTRTARADVKTLSPNKLERWRRIVTEAAKQSGRSLVPEVTDARPLSDLPAGMLGLVAHPGAECSLQEILPEGPTEGVDVTIVTGPEGGLTEPEVHSLTDRGFTAVRLGPRILRAQTAPVALASALLLPTAL